MTPIQQTDFILKELCGGERLEAIRFVDQQFNLLQARAQVLLGLITVSIPVTGIAGSSIIQKDFYAGILVLTALLTTLVAAFMVLLGTFSIRWITERERKIEDVLLSLIERRNHKTRWFRYSVYTLILGLIQFCLCFVVYFCVSHSI